MTEHVEQHPREWLATATPEEINAARKAGHLNEVLGIPAPKDYTAAEITHADLASMTNEEIVAALAEGRLGGILKGGE